MRKLEKKLVKWLKFTPRRDDNEAELRALWQSYSRRPVHPIVAGLDGTVHDGNRRIRGGVLEGKFDAEVECLLTDEEISPAKLKEIALVSAVHRKDLSDYEKAVALREIKAAHPGMTNKQLAEEILALDPSMPTLFLSLFDRCIVPVQEAAAAGQLKVSIWYGCR